MGKSTLATNLAVALHRQTLAPTALIDLNAPLGGVGAMLGIAPSRSLSDLPETDGVLDEFIVRHASGVHVLFRSSSAVDAGHVDAPSLEGVLNRVTQEYRYVIVDMPHMLGTLSANVNATVRNMWGGGLGRSRVEPDAVSRAMLDRASMVLVVASMFDLQVISKTRQLLPMITGQRLMDKDIQIVLNRVSRQNQLPLREVEEALDHQIAAQIINDRTIVPESITQGIPLVMSHPDSAIARSVSELARTLVDP